MGNEERNSSSTAGQNDRNTPAGRNDCKHRNDRATAADTRPGRAMRIPVVTQNIPNDGERVVQPAEGEAPSQQQLEQDVLATNPSIESMQSRG